LGRGGETGHYEVGGPGGDFGGCGHPAGEVGFERELVGIAVVVGLAFDFPHDVGGVYGGAGGVVGEEGGGGVEETLGAIVPELGLCLLRYRVSGGIQKGSDSRTYNIPHVCGANEENADIVTPL